VKDIVTPSPDVCAIYARTASLNNQAIVDQVSACRLAAQQQGWGSAENLIFVDNGTGSDLHSVPPGLITMLGTMLGEEPPAKCIVIADVYRLAQGLEAFLKILRGIEYHPISVFDASTSSFLDPYVMRHQFAVLDHYWSYKHP
jgi:hypothetical protein